MTTLTSYEKERIEETLPEVVVEMLRVFGDDICVAGGFIRDVVARVKPKDVDIFVVDSTTLQTVVDWFEIHAGLYTDRKETANSISFYKKDESLDLPVIQFITRAHYRSHLGLINSFDFTICQAAFWFDDYLDIFISACSDSFHEGIFNRQLVYTAPVRDEDPGASLLRMTRFLGRGYTISEASLAAVVGRFVHRNSFGWVDEKEAVEKAKEAFKRVGYAGKQVVINPDDDLPF